MAQDRKDSNVFDGTNIESLPQWLRDFIDYQNEAAGRDTGRVKRFLSEGRFDTPEQRKEKERRFDTLLRLLQDPRYGKLYFEAADIVRRAGEAAEKAMQRLARDSALATRRVDDLRESAAELPNGRKVFGCSRDGKLYTESGTDVTERHGSVSGLTKNSPSWEEYQAAKSTADEIGRQMDEIEIYRRDVLDTARERLGDTENPPSTDELKEIIERTKKGMSPAVRDALEPAQASGPDPGIPTNDAVADEIAGAYRPAAPDVFGAFKTAHDDAYASSSATPLPTTGPKPS